MIRDQLQNLNILSEEILLTPHKLKIALPLGESEYGFIHTSRENVRGIIERRDPRYLMIVGPCSIHDLAAAHDYARRLQDLSGSLKDVFQIVMRVYFEKPRSTAGWKGFINDPRMDDSFRIDEGLFRAREFLIQLAKLRIPVGTEALDPIIPQYLDDLITWTAIGARTTESQTHREMASGLSTPVGFKNSTDGNIDIAINALCSSRRGHNFLGINQKGQIAILKTSGNSHGHLVLRGGSLPNYDPANIARCEERLAAAGLAQVIMVDCSHGNSLKDPARQQAVLESCVDQIAAGNHSIIGMMIESNINAGRQDPNPSKDTLKYGISVTDSCIDWETTELWLHRAHKTLQPVLGLG